MQGMIWMIHWRPLPIKVFRLEPLKETRPDTSDTSVIGKSRERCRTKKDFSIIEMTVWMFFI